VISQDDLDRFKKSPTNTRGSSAHFPDRSKLKSDNITPNTVVPASRLDAQRQLNEIPISKSDATQNNYKRSIKHRGIKLSKFLPILLIVVIFTGIVTFCMINKHSDPIPKQYRSNLSFSVYYPNKSKLPIGYSVNNKSYVNPVKNVLVYAIDYGANHLNVALQVKPSASALQEFVRVHLPLNKTVATTLGTATIGVLNNQAVASLPTSGNTWIIISGPTSVNQQKLIQVINSLIE
jgi:hypothetical protein